MASTRVYSTTTLTPAQKHRDEVARMAAAARKAREREAREANAERAIRLDEAEFGAATFVGFKVISDEGKYRFSVDRGRAAGTLARLLEAGAEVEFWTGREE
jgi:hypothetical protein